LSKPNWCHNEHSIHSNPLQLKAIPCMAPTPFTKSCSLRDRDLRPRAKDKDGRKDLNLNLNLKPRLAVNFKRAFQMVFWATPNYLTPGWPLKSASEADKLARSHIPYTISYPISHSSYPICTHTHTHVQLRAAFDFLSELFQENHQRTLPEIEVEPRM